MVVVVAVLNSISFAFLGPGLPVGGSRRFRRKGAGRGSEIVGGDALCGGEGSHWARELDLMVCFGEARYWNSSG